MPTKLKDMKSILVRNYMARINTYITGRPAIGKTTMVEAFMEQMRKKVPGFREFFFYAPTMSPMDIQASAPDSTTGLLRMYNNGALPNHYTDPDMVGAIFFGELPNADPATVKLLQKYVNGEDMSGVLRKPKGLFVIADGNRIEDKSGVQQQSRAFLSRFEQHDAYTDAADNIEHASNMAWHPHVQTFFAEHPTMIDNYDAVFSPAPNGQTNHLSEEGRRGIWANMRSWQRISDKEYVAEKTGTTLSLTEIIGNVGSGAAVAYQTHKARNESLASFADIMENPDTAPIPTALDEQFALCMIVALRCTEEQMPRVRTFGERLPVELQVALLRNITKRSKHGFNTMGQPEFVSWVARRDITDLLGGKG